MLWKIIYFIAPLAVLATSNSLIYLLVISRTESLEIKIGVSAFLGVLLFVGLIKLISFLARKAALPPSPWNSFRSVWVGIGIGFVVSGLSGYLYAQTQSKIINWSTFLTQLPSSSVASIGPATVEEAVFRYGIVHGTTYLSGSILGCTLGSVPFGLLHLINKLMGQNISLEYIIGVTLAGLLLSLLFIKHGLWAAIGCHWIWNSLANPWIKAMNLNKTSGMSDFEGAFTTNAVLLLTIFAVIAFNYISDKSRRDKLS